MITLQNVITQIRSILSEPESIPVDGRFYSNDEITGWINLSINELCIETPINMAAFPISCVQDTYDYNINLFNDSLELLYLNELNYHKTSWGDDDYRELPKCTRRELFALKSGSTALPICSLFSNIIHLGNNPETGDIIEILGRWKTPDISGYQIDSITINSGGSGYEEAGEDVTISSSSSTKSATGIITVTGGAITALTITTGGIGFGDLGDTLVITGDTSGANDATVTSYESSSVPFPLNSQARNAVEKYGIALGFLKKGKDIGTLWMSLYQADKKKISMYQEKLLETNYTKGLTVSKRGSRGISWNGDITV